MELTSVASRLLAAWRVRPGMLALDLLCWRQSAHRFRPGSGGMDFHLGGPGAGLQRPAVLWLDGTWAGAANGKALEFLTGYLSSCRCRGNVSCHMLFSFFAVPASQRRVLLFGVLGAIVCA